MAVVRYLIDKSALARFHRPAVTQAWLPPLQAGWIGLCEATELEVLYSARGPEDYERKREELHELWPWVPSTDRTWKRALEVQRLLATKAQHRSASLTDLLVAAVAEDSGLIVLHYDRDFDTIAALTDQPTQWIAPAGSIP